MLRARAEARRRRQYRSANDEGDRLHQPVRGLIDSSCVWMIQTLGADENVLCHHESTSYSKEYCAVAAAFGCDPLRPTTDRDGMGRQRDAVVAGCGAGSGAFVSNGPDSCFLTAGALLLEPRWFSRSLHPSAFP